jgi:hypothetical protein
MAIIKQEDLSARVDEFTKSTPMVEPEKDGAWRTAKDFSRGAGQGITFGLGDEITGAIESVIDKRQPGESLADAYRRNRDEARRLNREAEERSPWSYGGGDIVGSVVMPGGLVKGGAKLGTKAVGKGVAKAAGEGAAYGAARGYGSSEADTIGGDVRNAVGSAAVGGALGGAGRYVSNTLNSVGSGLVSKQYPARNFNKAVEKDMKAKGATDAERFYLDNLAKDIENYNRLSKSGEISNELGSLGVLAGSAVGGALGGPAGSVAGGAAGGYGGAKLGSAIKSSLPKIPVKAPTVEPSPAWALLGPEEQKKLLAEAQEKANKSYLKNIEGRLPKSEGVSSAEATVRNFARGETPINKMPIVSRTGTNAMANANLGDVSVDELLNILGIINAK